MLPNGPTPPLCLRDVEKLERIGVEVLAIFPVEELAALLVLDSDGPGEKKLPERGGEFFMRLLSGGLAGVRTGVEPAGRFFREPRLRSSPEMSIAAVLSI